MSETTTAAKTSSSSSASSTGSRKVIIRGPRVPGANDNRRTAITLLESNVVDAQSLNTVSAPQTCSLSTSPSSNWLDLRYVTSFHGFLKVTALVSCLGAISVVATAEQCWYDVSMSLNILWSLAAVSAAFTLLFYAGHLFSLQRRFQKKSSKTSSAVVFADVVLSAFSFVSMIVAGFVTSNCGCEIERSAIVGSAFFAIFASFLYLMNFAWLTWKYYLDCNLKAN